MDRSSYPDHQDLLDQVADSREEAANVRRILSGLTEADLDAQQSWKRAPFAVGAANHAHRHSRPACSRCESGMAQCVTPTACECAEPTRQKPHAGDLLRIAALFLGVWAAVVFVLLVTGLNF